ncbi:hypothetical protein EDWATA_03780 [Edwardsiella tarda ATCC 23685]|uniref:Uncharacterized protein n=1 Tax=Edwardsiella tarda ATCC 23685 TaxID=500638 RepID=D4FAG2_EDWTA|nr:hypothetical protein EDWATA_03780 [Edwardsiella tarda ATCC 23685]
MEGEWVRAAVACRRDAQRCDNAQTYKMYRDAQVNLFDVARRIVGRS